MDEARGEGTTGRGERARMKRAPERESKMHRAGRDRNWGPASRKQSIDSHGLRTLQALLRSMNVSERPSRLPVQGSSSEQYVHIRASQKGRYEYSVTANLCQLDRRPRQAAENAAKAQDPAIPTTGIAHGVQYSYPQVSCCST